MDTNKPTVLILEDEPLIAMDMESTLRDAGYDVSIVSTCLGAKRWLESLRPDIVVADILLSDGPCQNVVERIVADGIPFVVHSGDPAEAHADTPYARGSWLNKPSLPDDLLKAVRQATSGQGQP